MKLEDSKELQKTREMIKDGSISYLSNTIWFCKYLINDYSKRNNKEIEYNYNFDVIEYNYGLDSLGDMSSDYWSKMVPSLVDFANSEALSSEEAVVHLFKELGYRVLMEEQSNFNLNNGFVFDNHAGYNVRQYMMYKETCFNEAIGQEQANSINQMYLSENESIIIGGNIFLEYINDNFSDCDCFNEYVEYFKENMSLAIQLIYGKVRDNYNESVDNFIMRNHEYFLEDEDSDLIIEFNRDGSRKSFIHLLMYRGIVNKKLEEKFFLYDDEKILFKINNAIEENDELFKYFMYKTIKDLPIESILEVVNLLSGDDLEFVHDSIYKAYDEIKKTVEYLNNTEIDEDAKYELVTYWQEKLNKCIAIKKIYEDAINKKMIKSNRS